MDTVTLIRVVAGIVAVVVFVAVAIVIYKTSKRPGVGGWLLLLCISLTIGGPLGGLSQAGHVTDSDHATVTVLVALGLAGLSFYAGYNLWRGRAKGIALTRFALALSFIGSLTDLSTNPTGALMGLIWAAVWWAYLVRSRRVRNTYNTEVIWLPRFKRKATTAI